MENYSKWAVWKLEDELERLSKEREALRAIAKHVTEIRDEKLRRGEKQDRPQTAPPKSAPKPGVFARMFGSKPPSAQGPDQVIREAGGIESRERVG